MKSLFYRLVGGFHHFGSDFLRVIYSILNASVILERNENLLARKETRLAGNENCLARNETRLARNETRGGNLHLSGTVNCAAEIVKDWLIKNIYKYWSSVLQTWGQKCTSPKNQNDTCGPVPTTTVLPLVLSKLELKVPVFVLTKYHPLPAI